MRKELQRIPGVGDAKIYIDEGRAELSLIQGHSIDLDAIEEAIRKGGYTPRDIWIEAVGRIERRGGQLMLVIPGQGMTFLLVENDPMRKLNRALAGQNDRPVTIVGKLQKAVSDGQPHRLIIERFEINSTSRWRVRRNLMGISNRDTERP